MTRMTDRIGQVERRLDRRNDDALDFLARRMLLREQFEAAAAEARQEGYDEGMRDAQDAQHASELPALAERYGFEKEKR